MNNIKKMNKKKEELTKGEKEKKFQKINVIFIIS